MCFYIFSRLQKFYSKSYNYKKTLSNKTSLSSIKTYKSKEKMFQSVFLVLVAFKFSHFKGALEVRS